MKLVTTEELCDYLEAATVERTIDLGHAVVNHGISAFGHRFTAVHDYRGSAVLTEAD